MNKKQLKAYFKYRRKIKKIMNNVFELGLLRCGYCGIHFNLKMGDKPTIDHIIPKSKNGSNNLKNLIPCCFYCNSQKGNKLIEVKFPNPYFGIEGKSK